MSESKTGLIERKSDILLWGVQSLIPSFEELSIRKSNVKVCGCGGRYVPTATAPKSCTWCRFGRINPYVGKEPVLISSN